MHDSLSRLYRTKLVLLATVLLVFGLVLLIFGQWVSHRARWRWLVNWPVSDVGSGLFTTGLLGVVWQYVDGRDSEVRDTERLKRVLAESAPAMRDAVIKGFAFEPDDLARVATPDVLDRIVENGLALRLGDAGFAREVYQDVRKQAIGVPERLHNAKISIHLSPLPMGRGTTKGRARLLVATIRWEANLHPKYETRRFSCVSDLQEFREMSQENTANAVWYVSPRSGLDAGERSTFELLEFTVNGKPVKPRRTSKAAGQTYAVSMGHDATQRNERTSISYVYRTIVPVKDHVLRLRMDQPTKGLSVELDYTAAGFDHVTVLDYIASSAESRISRSPSGVPERVVTIESGGWAFPRSGVAFVWSDS